MAQKQQKSGPRKTVNIEVEAVLVGRDKIPIQPPEVEKLAAIGCKDSEIADWFGVDSNTLRYHFQRELIKGREAMKQTLRRSMLNHAVNGNAALLIFLSKNFLGMSDNPVGSQDLEPLPWNNTVPSQPPEAELQD